MIVRFYRFLRKFATMIRHSSILTILLVLTIMGCAGRHDNGRALDIVKEVCEEAYSTQDKEQTLLVADSLEKVGIITAPQADYLRAIAYDKAWQMRVAEYFYKKAYNACSSNPKEDWVTYGESGYRMAHLMGQRGDVEGELSVVTDILSKTEGHEDFPAELTSALLELLAGCQMQLKQPDEAKQTYAKSYEMMKKAVGGAGKGSFNMIVACCNIFDFFLRTSNYDEAEVWLHRTEEELSAYEQHGDPKLIEEYKGHVALFRAEWLQATGHAAEAETIYNAIPRSRIFNPLGINTAARYLMAAGRYAEAADMYARLDTTFVAADSARMTFDIISERVIPRYNADRKAGRNSNALAIADAMCTAIDSALVWQKQDDAAELAVIYHTHERELALEESETKTMIYRILAFSLVAIMLAIIITLWRLAIAHRRMLFKNHELYEVILREQRREVRDILRIAEQPQARRTPSEQLFLRLVELMKKQQPYTDAELNRDMLASMLGTNHRYIDDAIRKCSDSQSTKAFIDSYRVDHAARLLSDTDKPIALIAEMSGFANRTTFNDRFRNRYKMTPSEFRQAARD